MSVDQAVGVFFLAGSIFGGHVASYTEGTYFSLGFYTILNLAKAELVDLHGIIALLATSEAEIKTSVDFTADSVEVKWLVTGNTVVLVVVLAPRASQLAFLSFSAHEVLWGTLYAASLVVVLEAEFILIDTNSIGSEDVVGVAFLTMSLN